MGRNSTWHRSPVIAPVVYGTSSVAVSAAGFVFGYLLTDNIRQALYCLAFMETLLVLFLVECARTAQEGEK